MVSVTRNKNLLTGQQAKPSNWRRLAELLETLSVQQLFPAKHQKCFAQAALLSDHPQCNTNHPALQLSIHLAVKRTFKIFPKQKLLWVHTWAQQRVQHKASPLVFKGRRLQVRNINHQTPCFGEWQRWRLEVSFSSLSPHKSSVE